MTNGFDKKPKTALDSWLLTRNDGIVTLVENSDRELIGHIVIDRTNKHIGFVKKEDMDCAVHCLQVMKDRNSDKGYKIGVVRKPINGINQFKQGEVVMYREGEHPEGDDTKTLVVEAPMTAERIRENREKGSLITAYKTTVCVPRKYVMDVNQ